MNKVEFLNTILSLNIRKGNTIKVTVKDSSIYRRAYLQNTNTLELKVKNVNYYWWENQYHDGRGYGWHEIVKFELVNDKDILANIKYEDIDSIEIVKQSKSKVENPVIEQLKKYAPDFTETQNIVNTLNLK